MDGVVANFEKEINRLLPELHTSGFNDEQKHTLVEQTCMQHNHIFRNLEPVEGSIKAVKNLFNYYDCYFLSTPMWCVPASYTGKRRWIEEHFGEMATKRLILTHRKDLAIGHYLVDDRTKHGADKFIGKHILYGSPEFPNWEIIGDLLITYAEFDKIDYNLNNNVSGAFHYGNFDLKCWKKY